MLVEGEVAEGMNIYDRMEQYHIPGVSIAFLNDGKIGLDEDINLYLKGWQVEENKYIK